MRLRFGLAAVVVAAALATARPAQAGVLDNLLAYLKFDGNTNDSSGNGLNGTSVGTTPFGAGKFGQAIGLSNDGVQAPAGVFNYVTLGAPAQLDLGQSTDFSFSFWAKFSAWSGDPSFISNKDWNSGGNIGVVLATGSDGRFQWNYREAGGAPRYDYDGPAGTVNNGQWNHIAVTFDRGGNAVAYLNGAQVDSRSISNNSGTIMAPPLVWNIGQDGTGTYTDGSGGVKWTDLMMDDVAIFGRVLSASDVTAIYTAGQAGNDLSTVPEPSTVVLAALGGLGLIAAARRRVAR